MKLQTIPLKKSELIIDIELTNETEEVQEIIPRLDREARRGNWTGSQFKNLMSCDNTGGKMDWFNKEKVFRFSDGSIKYIFANAMERKTGRYLESDSTKEMKYGTKVEPLIRKRASLKLEKDGLILREVGYKPFPEIQTAGVSSDSIVLTKEGEIIASFESKACSSWTTLFERTYEKVNETSKDFWQIQGQMLAWEVDKNYYCVISPPQNINKYLYCDDIMSLYDEWCQETEMHIEIIEKSPIHLKALEKRIKIAECVVERFLAGEEENLKEVLHEEIDFWKKYWETDNKDLVEVRKNEEPVKENIFAKLNREAREKEEKSRLPVEPDMDDLPF